MVPRHVDQLRKVLDSLQATGLIDDESLVKMDKVTTTLEDMYRRLEESTDGRGRRT